MLKISGEVLDMYDDPTLTVLVDRHSAEGVREKFASVSVPSAEDLQDLDDDAFAAIFYEKVAADSAQRRAWPVHEPGICAISLEYFHKVASEGRVLPTEVRDQVANNLVANADLHGLTVPEEMRKWAEDHGEFLPENNWVSVDAYDSPARSVPTVFAYEKTASAGTTKLYPLDDAECVRASLDSFEKEGWDIHGLGEWDARMAANRMVDAAAEHGVVVSEKIAAFAQLRMKSAEEIHGALLSRVERVPVALRDSQAKVAAFHEAIGVIESETDGAKMAARVAEFDLAVGFGEDHYRAGLAHPVQVIYEPVDKLASVEDPILERIGREKISEYLGEDVLAEFEADPQAAFNAQPEEIREFLLNG